METIEITATNHSDKPNIACKGQTKTFLLTIHKGKICTMLKDMPSSLQPYRSLKHFLKTWELK